MKHWEIIANNLKKGGFSLGWVSAVDSQGRTIWIDAHGYGKRFIVRADEKLTAFVVTVSASIALSDDFKTYNGKEYKNVTVTQVEADGIVVRTKAGVSKLYFTELPEDVQKRFNYDPEKAAAAQRAAVHSSAVRAFGRAKGTRGKFTAANRASGSPAEQIMVCDQSARSTTTDAAWTILARADFVNVHSIWHCHRRHRHSPPAIKTKGSGNKHGAAAVVLDK